MSNIGYKAENDEINKLITRLQQILSELESRIKKLEQGS
tara:strand:+ start:572 stop:688 length:117 start_codon:yes stop_codon:yes gene_type:complete